MAATWTSSFQNCDLCVGASLVEVGRARCAGDTLNAHSPVRVMRNEAHVTRVRGPGVAFAPGGEAAHRD
eukprot:3007312-Alexandrium_andersonii.AAC.1